MELFHRDLRWLLMEIVGYSHKVDAPVILRMIGTRRAGKSPPDAEWMNRVVDRIAPRHLKNVWRKSGRWTFLIIRRGPGDPHDLFQQRGHWSWRCVL